MQTDRIGYANRAENEDKNDDRNGAGGRSRHSSRNKDLRKRFGEIGRNADGSLKWYEAYGVSNSWDSQADMRKPSIEYILDDDGDYPEGMYRCRRRSRTSGRGISLGIWCR